MPKKRILLFGLKFKLLSDKNTEIEDEIYPIIVRFVSPDELIKNFFFQFFANFTAIILKITHQWCSS